MNPRPRNLGGELEIYSLVGLNAQDQHVRFRRLACYVLKKTQRRGLEGDRNLSGLAGQPFAMAQVERNPCPAPVVDLQFQRNERLDVRARVDTLLLPVA